jgi:hypothetical protein
VGELVNPNINEALTVWLRHRPAVCSGKTSAILHIANYAYKGGSGRLTRCVVRKINENMVRYTAEYTHTAYQAATFRFMDWVAEELNECQNLCR